MNRSERKLMAPDDWRNLLCGTWVFWVVFYGFMCAALFANAG